MWVPKITNTNPKLLVLCLRKDEQINLIKREKEKRNYCPKFENSKALNLSLGSANSLSLRGLVGFWCYEKW